MPKSVIFESRQESVASDPSKKTVDHGIRYKYYRFWKHW